MVDLWISVLFSWSHFPMGSRKFSMHCLSGSLQCGDVELLTMAVFQILASCLGGQHVWGLSIYDAQKYVAQICCLDRQLTRIWDSANSTIMHFRTFLRDWSRQCFKAKAQSKGEVRVVPCGAVCHHYVFRPVSGGSSADWARKGTGATSSRPFSPRSGTTAACEDQKKCYSSESEK